MVCEYMNSFMFIEKSFSRSCRRCVRTRLKQNIDKVLGHLTKSGKVMDDHIRSLFFGDYINPEGEKIYDEVTDLKELTKVMD